MRISSDTRDAALFFLGLIGMALSGLPPAIIPSIEFNVYLFGEWTAVTTGGAIGLFSKPRNGNGKP